MTKDLKAPAPASDKEPGEPKYELMAAAHLIAAAPGRYLENTELGAAMGGAACELYRRLAPRDTRGSMLSLLAVSTTNASLDCLALAARVPPDYLEARELNLRLGLKAAEAAAKLIKALDDRDRERPDKVTVGAVNVEAGGQAIVGNVETARHSAPTKDASRLDLLGNTKWRAAIRATGARCSIALDAEPKPARAGAVGRQPSPARIVAACMVAPKALARLAAIAMP